MKINIVRMFILLGMLIGTVNVSAVTYDSMWSANRNNTKGTTTRVLPAHVTHFCYLNKVKVEETDTRRESARCRVRRSGIVWVLEATLGKSSDADVACGAICYNN